MLFLVHSAISTFQIYSTRLSEAELDTMIPWKSHLLSAAAAWIQYGLYPQHTPPLPAGRAAHPSADQVEIERKQLQHDLCLADQRVNLARREVKKRFGNQQSMDQATREYENRMREQKDQWGVFKDYKLFQSTMNLSRAMTRKEAFKAFLHTFHGKGSGKAKAEKKLKKIANEWQWLVCR